MQDYIGQSMQGFHPVIKVRAVQQLMELTHLSADESFHPVIKVRAVQQANTTMDILLGMLFSSRYQSPGGATFKALNSPLAVLGFHPVIKVRAVQRDNAMKFSHS